MKLETYDSSPFIGESYFIIDESQIFLIFHSILKTFKKPAVLTDILVESESKGM